MKNNSSQDHDKELNSYWESLRSKNFDSSFLEVSAWIKKNNEAATQAQRMKSRSRKRFNWSVAAVIFSLFIFSCTYRVERFEKFGDLVNFSLDKQDNQSLLRLGSLQQVLNFKLLQFQKPHQTETVSFISLIREDDKKVNQVRRELSSLSTIKELDIVPVEYTVKESLFLTFVHKTLNIPQEEPTQKTEELEKTIEAKLKNKGLDYISIDIDESKIEPVFSITEQVVDTATNSPVSLPVADSIRKNKHAQQIATRKTKELEKFNWLPGTWKVKNVPNETWHYWRKVNDSSFKCFVIEVTKNEKTNMTVGFFIRLAKDGSMMLSLKGAQWQFISSTADEFIFRNDLEKNPHVKWVLKDDRKTWQSIISGEGNAEFINLTKENDNKFEKMVKELGKQYPGIYN